MSGVGRVVLDALCEDGVGGGGELAQMLGFTGAAAYPVDTRVEGTHLVPLLEVVVILNHPEIRA